MPKSNEDSSIINLNKLERPPLKRPKTLSIPSSSSSTTNRRFDLGVSIENASGNGDFPNEQWKYPSFLGTTRRKRNTVKPTKIQFSNSMASQIGRDHKKAGNNNTSVVQPNPSSSSSTSCSLSTSTSVVTLQEHSSSIRRPHQSKHTSILYLVSDLFPT